MLTNALSLFALLPLLLNTALAAPSHAHSNSTLSARGSRDVWVNSATIVTEDPWRLKLRKGDRSKIDKNEHAAGLNNLPIAQDEGEVSFVVWTKKEGAECTFKGKSTKEQTFTFSATADDMIMLHQCNKHNGALIACNKLPENGGGWVKCG